MLSTFHGGVGDYTWHREKVIGKADSECFGYFNVQRKSCPIARDVDFAIDLVFFVLNLPDRQVLYFGKFKLQKDCYQSCQSKRVLGLVEMTCALVHAVYSLPERQAVKLTFFAPWFLLSKRFLLRDLIGKWLNSKRKKTTVLYWSTSDGHKPPGTSLFQALCWSDRHHMYVAKWG